METKKYFAGVNSATGFYNYYSYLFDNEKEGFLYILKGGPGTGKSTLMKKVGAALEEKGESVEYFYCSSDSCSLDGVRAVDSNIAVVDGTAPHTMDPGAPGAKEIIINLGQFIGEDIKKYKQRIFTINNNKQQLFNLAYKYIASATSLLEANRILYSSVTNLYLNNNVAIQLFDKVTHENQTSFTSERKLFETAITPEGVLRFTDTNAYKEIIGLKGNPYAGELILQELAEKLTKSGYDFISFYSPLSPSIRESISVNDTLFTLSDEVKVTSQIELLSDLKDNKVALFNEIQENKTLMNTLVEKTHQTLYKSKIEHLKLETMYYSCMDFVSITEVTNNLIKQIFNSL
ncbi:MAG: hypothetical protein WC942_05080 [Clostridia bacterium]|jgi:hypothetical protein|nr:hypothetical protein [Clostridia bacterium]